MKNVTELRKHLSKIFSQLIAGEITHAQAAELANIAGKMINSAKVQVEYYALRKQAPSIAFLVDDIDTQLPAPKRKRLVRRRRVLR